MKTISLSQGKFAQVDDEDYDFLIQWKWYAYNSYKDLWYAARGSQTLSEKTGKRFLIKMHREIMKVSDGKLIIDHINHNGLDNQKSNLRICTRSQNSQNTRSRIGSSSKYLGVSWYTAENRWVAAVKINGKKRTLGRFKIEEDAARAYDNAAKEHAGEFANLNFK